MVHDTGSERRRSKKRRGAKRIAAGEGDDSQRTQSLRGWFEPRLPGHAAPRKSESRGEHRAAAHHVPEPAPGAKHKTGAEPQPASSSLFVSRRKLLLTGGGLAAAFAGLEAMRHLATTPVRLSAGSAGGHGAQATTAQLSDIQFDLSAFASPALTINGVVVSFPPVYTLFAPAKLGSTPTQDDQRQLADALDRIEEVYPFSAEGVFTFIAYGLPYFNRFPSWMFNTLVPRLASDNSRFVLEEAVPSPTDVSPVNPGITKERFNVPVRIEQNDLLFTLRSDNVDNLWDVMAFLGGSNRLGGEHVPSPNLSTGLTFTSARVMFVQQGLPRSVAENNKLPFAPYVNPQSPMWMGFADQQVNASAPAQNVTFVGGGGIDLTTAEAGDYFDLGSMQHLSHDILDMLQFFDMTATTTPGDDGTFLEHVQYMFRADPPPSMGVANQFINGGGPSFLPNVFQGFDDAMRSAEGIGTLPDPTTGKPQHRMGHISCLQRSSRTAAGDPIHLRMDGPGFDTMDVPDGTEQAKLQFTVFVPSADFFATMRVNQASLDLQNEFGVDPSDNGLERFITATRRQNFLIPPRRHRAFPFAELGHSNPSQSRASRSSVSRAAAPSNASNGSSSNGGNGSNGSNGHGGHNGHNG
jgi:hypothetical protein